MSIHSAFDLAGNSGRLKDVFDALEGEVDYRTLRCVATVYADPARQGTPAVTDTPA